MKFKSCSLYIYIHVHPYESRFQTIIHKYAKFFMYIARVHITKKHQVKSIFDPKYINKTTKWPIETKKLQATTNNCISKSLPILGSYSSITPCAPSSRVHPLPLP